MISIRRFFAVAALVFATSMVSAGELYSVTSTDGKSTTTYSVRFGGGKRFEQYTAFDPATKTFVYLKWNRGTPAPEPVGKIWDHRSGEIIELFKFPGVEQPLPVIASIKDLKICPLTGDRNLKADRKAFID